MKYKTCNPLLFSSLKLTKKKKKNERKVKLMPGCHIFIYNIFLEPPGRDEYTTTATTNLNFHFSQHRLYIDYIVCHLDDKIPFAFEGQFFFLSKASNKSNFKAIFNLPSKSVRPRCDSMIVCTWNFIDTTILICYEYLTNVMLLLYVVCNKKMLFKVKYLAKDSLLRGTITNI